MKYVNRILKYEIYNLSIKDVIKVWKNDKDRIWLKVLSYKKIWLRYQDTKHITILDTKNYNLGIKI